MISKEQALTRLGLGLSTLAIKVPPAAVLDRLWLYFTELLKWNSKINLVAKGPELDLLENHFLDSFTLVPTVQMYLRKEPSQRLADIGSGAGFPGLVLKIACPDLPVTLVEPRQKRTAFLRHIARTLNLEKLTILEERINKDDQQFLQKHGQFSLITCRALASIQDFLDMTAHIAAPAAKILCMKGPKAEDELKSRPRQADCFEVTSSSSFTLPFSGAARTLIVFTKTSRPHDAEFV
jgi:16S rRNA (guanine527-N7)-methyltransferase